MIFLWSFVWPRRPQRGHNHRDVSLRKWRVIGAKSETVENAVFLAEKNLLISVNFCNECPAYATGTTTAALPLEAVEAVPPDGVKTEVVTQFLQNSRLRIVTKNVKLSNC